MDEALIKTSADPIADRFAPAVTVLMSVRDVPVAMLEQAMESILGQIFHDFEFLIYNDGAEDPKIVETLDRYAEMDARIVLRHEPARGLTKTLNVGLRDALGRYVARQDADDWSAPDRLAKQVDFLQPSRHRRVRFERLDASGERRELMADEFAVGGFED